MSDTGLVLYDHPVSSNALKVRFLLAELGLSCEKVHVPFSWPRPETYTALNPFGRIPTLVDDDVVVGESNAILRYIARRERRDDLYPREPADQARVEWALDAWSTQVRPMLMPAEAAALFHTDQEGGSGRPEDADQAAVAAALGPAREALALFERFIADNGTVLGTFTIADCAVAPVLWRSYRLPLSLEGLPKVALLRETATGRPAFRAAGPVA